VKRIKVFSCCWKATPTRAFNEFLYEFLRIFLISENSLKFANFFAEVTNSRSMTKSTNCSKLPLPTQYFLSSHPARSGYACFVWKQNHPLLAAFSSNKAFITLFCSSLRCVLYDAVWCYVCVQLSVDAVKRVNDGRELMQELLGQNKGETTN